jgi:hypothetical protein
MAIVMTNRCKIILADGPGTPDSDHPSLSRHRRTGRRTLSMLGRRRRKSALQMNAPSWIRRRCMTIGSRGTTNPGIRPAPGCCGGTGLH